LIKRGQESGENAEKAKIKTQITEDIRLAENDSYDGIVTPEEIEDILYQYGEEIIYDTEGIPIGVITTEEGYEIYINDVWQKSERVDNTVPIVVEE